MLKCFSNSTSCQTAGWWGCPVHWSPGAQHSVRLQAGQVLTEVLPHQVPALPRSLPQERLLHISHLRPAGRGPSGPAGREWSDVDVIRGLDYSLLS